MRRPPSPLFDAEAADFDLRVGLPAEVTVRVAEAVSAAAATSGVVLELGAGTGQLGVEICRRVTRYVAVDESERMLARLRERMSDAGLHAEIVHGDARAPWPVAPGDLSVVFGSRFWHWVDADAAVEQIRRLSHADGCTLLVGRVEREPSSLQEVLRTRLHEELRRRGFTPRAADRGSGVLGSAASAGAVPLPPRQLGAGFPRRRTPRDGLQAWATKRHLAGIAVPNDVRHEVLRAVERWTVERFGNIDTPQVDREIYVLEGARFGNP